MTNIKFSLGLICIFILIYSNKLRAEEQKMLFPPDCVDMEPLFEYSEEARLYQKELEKFTEKFIKMNNHTLSNTTYVIPVVFHVFWEDFANYKVNKEVIELALQKTNEDFQGLNDDFNTVYHLFLDRRGTLDIEFRLAKIDPNGKPTTGVIHYPPQGGFANSDMGTHKKVAAYAWDNYSYMNVFITVDLFGDGNYNYSGYAYYPNKQLSDINASRVVYNGKYLYGNTDKEFASVLTHEFGHWLNLYHTFQDGCTYPNDYVEDTPPVDKPYMGCIARNCEQQHINGENYMDYNASCYKMFTQGQVLRMKAALESETRITLWSNENLLLTGLSTTNNIHSTIINNSLSVYPNPMEDILNINFTEKFDGTINIKIFDILGQLLISTDSGQQQTELNFSNLPSGVYFIQVYDEVKIYNEIVVK